MIMDSPILITGPARSGTSMVSGIVARHGVWIGECANPNISNPVGFYENSSIRDGAVRTLLSSHGYDMFGISPLPAACFDNPVDLAFITEQLILSNGYLGGQWLYKDAKLALMWRPWNTSFPDAKWIVVTRDKEDIVKSCIRSFMNHHLQQGEDFWSEWVEEYLFRIRDLVQSVNNCRLISSESIVRGNYDELEEVIEVFLGQKFDKEAVKDFVNPDLFNLNGEKQKINKDGLKLNTPLSKRISNIESNIKLQLPQAQPYPINDQSIAVVAGGPSLNKTYIDLRCQYNEGTKLVAVNGTHDWLIERGMKPSVMVMVDAREINLKFVKKPIEGCKYFIASQCHPSIFEALKDQELYIFHSLDDGTEEKKVLDNYYFGNYHFVIGGSTVALRTIWLMRMLGFRRMDVYGFDSCYMDGNHHAYIQSENDGKEVRKVTCLNKDFLCNEWMVDQANDFKEFVKSVGGEFELNVHGDGLISYMMEKGAEIYTANIESNGGIENGNKRVEVL